MELVFECVEHKIVILGSDFNNGNAEQSRSSVEHWDDLGLVQGRNEEL